MAAHASAERIAENIRLLAAYSTEAGAITRQTYSAAWQDSLLLLADQMRALGMTAEVDGLGNLWGLYDPEDCGRAPVGVGSHLDTVPQGGAYDGAAGIVAALELVQVARENRIRLPRPLAVIAFAEEEGGVFGKGCLGSEYAAGRMPLEAIAALADGNGRTVKAHADALPVPKRPFGSDYGWAAAKLCRFYELHVEQGDVLEQDGKRLGIVGGVVGILRERVAFVGQENHAGTTRMAARRDAAVAMADFVRQVWALGHRREGELVATTGYLAVRPNQHNVVPGYAETTLELRGPEDRAVNGAADELEAAARRIAAQYGVEARWDNRVYVPARAFPRPLADGLWRAADELGCAGQTRDLFSWAGHDAKILAEATPAAMLFVPSAGGLSHCGKERSDARDIALGVDVLLAALEGWDGVC